MWLLVIGIMAACLLSQTSTTHAYPYPVNQCAGPRYGSDLGCTANDVSITNMRVVGDATSCTGGSTVTLDLELTVNFQPGSKYDVGIFISNDGKDPQLTVASGGSASCSVSVLPPSSPFLNLDGPTDTCGDGNKADIGGGTGSGIHYMPGVTVACQALAGSGGNLYIPFVVSWDVNKTPPGAICTSNENPVPGTSSKCNAPLVAQGTVSVVVMPTITNTDGITTISSGGTTNYTVVITNTTGVALSGAVFKDPEVANINVNNISCTSTTGGATCPGSVTIADMQGAGITIPAMPVGSSVTFTINATLVGNPGETRTNTASVTVGSQTKSASDTNTIVGDIAILPTSSSKYGSPGTLVVHNYTLYNFSGSTADISLSASSNQVPPWTVQLSTSSVTLNSGESANFTVTVTAGAAIGTVDVTTITATSGSNTATATAVTTVASPLTLTPDNTGSGGQNSSVFYDHRVQNNTASSQPVTFSTVLSGSCTGWTAVSPASVTLAAFGGYQDVILRVNIPSTAAINDTCTATVTASAGGNSDDATDATTVKGIVLYSNPAYSDETYTYPAGVPVYARVYGTAATQYRFYWYDPSYTLMRTSPLFTGPGTLSDFYDIPLAGPLGTWNVKVQRVSDSFIFAQTDFYVGPDHISAGNNIYAAVNSNNTPPITLSLHDRYNHVVPAVSGSVVQGNQQITVTISGSATIVSTTLDTTCSGCGIVGQTVTGKLDSATGTATITIRDNQKETVTVTPNSTTLLGSKASPDRDEPITVTFVRMKMKVIKWREVQ